MRRLIGIVVAVLVAGVLVVQLSPAKPPFQPESNSTTQADRPQLPPPKQAIQEQYNQERAVGLQSPAPRNPNLSYPTTPLVSPITGINDSCSAPFPAIDVVINNCWQGSVNGVMTIVYAGAESDNSQQGIVIVDTVPDYPAAPTEQRVETPIQAGSVTVAAAQTPILMLVSDTGSYTLIFNLNSDTFVSVASVPLVSIPTTQIAITSSGLAYSRATQTFSGTLMIKNISTSTIQAPFQIVFASLTPAVSLTNQRGTFNDNPYITMPAVSNLAPGQIITATVQFKNSSNKTINFTPVVYSGSF